MQRIDCLSTWLPEASEALDSGHECTEQLHRELANAVHGKVSSNADTVSHMQLTEAIEALDPDRESVSSGMAKLTLCCICPCS